MSSSYTQSFVCRNKPLTTEQCVLQTDGVPEDALGTGNDGHVTLEKQVRLCTSVL